LVATRTFARRIGGASPVVWTWNEKLGLAIARRRAPVAPAILVLSLPRSGSSWVGETLGRATNALYLREPLNQSRARGAEADVETVFEIDESHPPPPYYVRAAGHAFAGFPRFAPDIVTMPRQWALRRRARARLVIKEVNPFACEWLVREFRPRVIMLVRHPAAIAHSYWRVGWVGSSEDVWLRLGQRFARALSAASAVLQGHDDARVATYEALRADPLGGFRALFEFADLRWTGADAAFVERNDVIDPAAPATLARDGHGRGDAWRSELPPAAQADLKAGYFARSIPWYQADADW
jgi:hypothetical protein